METKVNRVREAFRNIPIESLTKEEFKSLKRIVYLKTKFDRGEEPVMKRTRLEPDSIKFPYERYIDHLDMKERIPNAKGYTSHRMAYIFKKGWEMFRKKKKGLIDNLDVIISKGEKEIFVTVYDILDPPPGARMTLARHSRIAHITYHEKKNAPAKKKGGAGEEKPENKQNQ